MNNKLKTSTADRLKEIMSKLNIRQIDIVNMCKPYADKYRVKIGRNDISQYLSGKVEPGQSKIFILAKALDVNEAWLMGYDVCPQRNVKQEDEAFTAEKFNALNEKGKEMVIEYIRMLSNNNKYKKESLNAIEDDGYEIAAFGGKETIGVPEDTEPEITT